MKCSHPSCVERSKLRLGTRFIFLYYMWQCLHVLLCAPSTSAWSWMVSNKLFLYASKQKFRSSAVTLYPTRKSGCWGEMTCWKSLGWISDDPEFLMAGHLLPQEQQGWGGGRVSVQEAGCSPAAAPVPQDRRMERSLRGCLEFLLRNEHSFMAREIRNVWQLWLQANALFTEICVLMLLMFSFRSSEQ